MSRREIEDEVRRRFAAAVAAFDRGACAEEATAELTPDLYAKLPEGPVKEAARAAFRRLAADPPGSDRESAVRDALSKMGSDPIFRETP
ncbi:MAG TPA: hypothetical protein VFV10_17820 [Gammaproteobacteria bacterium]|nr:hypothetical protein [Gammaproteobacteria bacterium]